MPAISRFSIKTLLSQLNKRDYPQNEGGDDGDAKSPVAIVGLVIAALTFFATMIPLFRYLRFRRWVPMLPIPSFVKKTLGIIALPGPPPATIVTDDLSTIPVAEITIPQRVLIYNNYSNTYVVDTHSNTPPYCHNVITRENGRVPQVEEPLGLRRLDI
ncbi:hypothetical protein HOY80DRAFT_1140082 [Tuber brumale]|nr:hypothetical protein HOY80DRAFT_1140082 [Tuber brumale]